MALAAGVSAHLVAVTLGAAPSASGGLNRSAWQDPTVQAEFAAWSARLGGWGGTPAALEQRLWGVAVGWEAGRSWVLAPFQPYYRWCGTWQSWKMFVAPHTHPTQLRIEVERGGVWQLAYVERSAEARWLAGKLDHDRFRSVIFRAGWPHYQPLRQHFAAWAARRAAVDFPDATRIRLSFRKRDTLPAAALAAGDATPERTVLTTVVPVPR